MVASAHLAHRMARRGRRAGMLVLVASTLALSLAACTTPGGPGGEDPSASPSEAPGEPTSGAETPGAETPTPTPPPPVSEPVSVDCATLVPSQALYDFNPNFGVDAAYSPADDSLPGEIVELDGVACGYINQTSGEQIEFAVAHLVPEEAQKRKDALVVANVPVPIYVGDEGYFTVEDAIGQAQVFSGEYWVVSRSSAFYEPGDHADLLNAVVDNVVALAP